MTIRIFLLILSFCGINLFSAYSQGKIIMLNGKEKRFSTAEVKGEVIVYQQEGEKKFGGRKLDRYDVFSIIRDNGTEEIIYSPDTVSGEDPTVAEVRDYIIGEKYASLTYNKPANFVTGMELGFVSGLVLPVFYGFAVPVVYSITLSQFNPKVPQRLVYNYNSKTGSLEPLPGDSTVASNIVMSDAFSAGYGKKARSMKFKKSLLGGAIGFGIGATAIAIIKAQ